MVSCLPKSLKIPHITNRAQRVAAFRQIVRIFLLQYGFINILVLLVGALCRWGLSLPAECSEFGEDVYLSTYTLIAVAILGFGLSMMAYLRTQHFRHRGHLRIYLLIYMVVIAAEAFLVPMMALFQSHQMRNIVDKRASVFATNQCLNEIQSQHRCCGFKNYTEWQSYVFDSNGYHNASSDTEDLKFYSSGIKSAFPDSCQCDQEHATRCVTLTYNRTDWPIGLNSSTESIINFIYTTPCFPIIVNELGDIQLAIGVSSFITFVINLVTFLVAFYTIHNLEGFGTVSDIYRPSSNNSESSSPQDSERLPSACVNHLQSQPNQPNATSEPERPRSRDSVGEVEYAVEASCKAGGTGLSCSISQTESSSSVFHNNPQPSQVQPNAVASFLDGWDARERGSLVLPKQTAWFSDTDTHCTHPDPPTVDLQECQFQPEAALHLDIPSSNSSAGGEWNTLQYTKASAPTRHVTQVHVQPFQ